MRTEFKDLPLAERRRRGNRQLLIVGVAMTLFVAAVAFVSRSQPPLAAVASSAPTTSARVLRFEVESAGALQVFDAVSGELIKSFAADEGSFVRSTLRVVSRERAVKRADPAAPLQLALHSDGAVILRDEASGVAYDLRAFGRTNRDAFVQLLDVPAGTHVGARDSDVLEDAPENLQTNVVDAP
ncbi:MAG: photosynthetic complex assembly protein PuhC [Pseudomonadota bacterium]